MIPSEMLTKARNVLLERGWTKGILSDGRYVCAIGALNIAATGSHNIYGDEDVQADETAQNNYRKARYELDRAAKEAGGYHSVADFNDHYVTTIDDVTALFDKAVAHAQELGE